MIRYPPPLLNLFPSQPLLPLLSLPQRLLLPLPLAQSKEPKPDVKRRRRAPQWFPSP